MSTHRLRPTLLAAILACSAAMNLAQAAASVRLQSAADEPAFLAAVGVTPQMPLKYQDEDGRSLTREVFYERLSRAEGKLSLAVRKTAQEATLQLQAAGKRPEIGRFKVAPGESMPAFSLRSLDQAALTPEMLRGRYTLMSFYFATCAPCVAEIPALNSLQAHMPELRLAAVTFDDETTSRRFVQDHGLRWPVYAQARPFLQSLGVSSFPAFALLNPEGKLVSIGPLYELQHSPNPSELLQRWVQEQIARDSGKT
ncbi:TlpA family protein disulfide reductase [Roseateles sp. DB2]|uniref:TlpA family protein disulfide reductase n=1 Tax=Roseateles sp. DB2 TaxID=3453717 RepID=UPI003EE852B9